MRSYPGITTWTTVNPRRNNACKEFESLKFIQKSHALLVLLLFHAWPGLDNYDVQKRHFDFHWPLKYPQ